MKILLINPNSSPAVTQAMSKAAGRCRREGLVIDTVCCQEAPAAIVTAYDELLAGAAAVRLLQEREQDYDGAVIGCFADPGLAAARETLHIPVTGLYESSALFARLRGERYSLLASGDEGDLSPWNRSIRQLGDESHVASVRYLGSTVEAALGATDEELCRCIEECRRRDGANVVILGCAAFAGRGARLTQLCDIPVIDGIAEAISLIKMMIEYNREVGK